MTDVPDFDDLPRVEGMPHGCAWGIFDKEGKKDIYGTLNHLTPSVIKSAFGELNEGVSVSLNWPLGAVGVPGFNRIQLKHRVLSFMDTPAKVHSFDDELEFNTQGSSQWDGMCHYMHQATARGYNGFKPTIEDLIQDFGNEDHEQKLPTLNHWHKRGGLVARGVLIDYKAYADENGIEYDPFTNHEITTDEIEAIAKKQGVQFKPGDVLVIRSGFTEALEGLSAEEQKVKLGTHRYCGVRSHPDTAKWIWNHRFAAAVGDALGLEAMPSKKPDGSDALITDCHLHLYLLVLFGMPIGELWDLKALSQKCKELNRYSFVLTSAPLNVAGSVASPPNSLALF